MSMAREHCGIFPQEGMPGGFPLTDLYSLLSITGTTCSSNRLSCFPSLTQGDQGMCQQEGKSDISGALSSLPHLTHIYNCTQLHFLITFSFQVTWENLLTNKFCTASLWMSPSHPTSSGSAQVNHRQHHDMFHGQPLPCRKRRWLPLTSCTVVLSWWVPVASKLHVRGGWSWGLGTGQALNTIVSSAWPHCSPNWLLQSYATVSKVSMILPHVTNVSWR